MAGWLLRRLLQSLATLAVATVVLFFLMRLTPGDPLGRLTEDKPVSPAEIARLRERYGLDQPLPRQFAAFVGGALRGDLGTSIVYGRPVTQLIAERLPASLLLGGTALVLTFGIGIVLGVWQARRRGRTAERVVTALALGGYAMPAFWLGLLLSWFFGVRHGLLPTGGMLDWDLGGAPWGARALDVLRHLLLPALTLTIVGLAAVMRHQRSAMLESLGAPFILTARAKGLPERTVTWRHAWRAALAPMVTLFGLWLPILVSGAVLVESVFVWPGLGSLAASALEARDYPLLMGTSMLVTVAVVAGGFLGELGQALVDPRVRPA
ncbi:MAG: ABC transporter permease [Gemmatimonadota bacterium]